MPVNAQEIVFVVRCCELQVVFILFLYPAELGRDFLQFALEEFAILTMRDLEAGLGKACLLGQVLLIEFC